MFVTIEGPEGAGKSTLLRALAERASAAGQGVVATREPGEGKIGERIRRILLEGGHLEPRAELFLFLADRAQHVANCIRPALAEGRLVLCDRFGDSTIVYQGYGRGFPIDAMRDYHSFAAGGLVPDLTILLDLDPAVGLARLMDKNRLDSEPIDFHRKVRDGFIAEASLDPARWLILDGAAAREELAKAAWAELETRINTMKAASR